MEPQIVPPFCARSEVTRLAVRDPVSIGTRRYVFLHKSNVDARRSNAHCLPPLAVRLLSSEGIGRTEVALPKGVDADSQEGIEALNTLSIANAPTDVRDCFHRFRVPHPLSKFFASGQSQWMSCQ